MSTSRRNDVGSTLFDWLQDHSPHLYNPNMAPTR